MGNDHTKAVRAGVRLSERKKPWEKHPGERLSTEELRFVSRYWSYYTWMEYLASLESPQQHFISRYHGAPDYPFNLKNDLGTILYGGEETDRAPFIDPELVKRALTRLRPNEQKVVHATYYRDMSQRETATLFGISAVRVHQVLKRALEKIKELLEMTQSDANWT